MAPERGAPGAPFPGVFFFRNFTFFFFLGGHPLNFFFFFPNFCYFHLKKKKKFFSPLCASRQVFTHPIFIARDFFFSLGGN